VLVRWGLVVVVLAAVGLAGCRSAASPVAATVGRHAIHQSEVDSELHHISANVGYVAALNSQGVPVNGTTAGSYDIAFVDGRVLTNLIVAELVHGQLVDDRLKVRAADVAVARQEVMAGLPQNGTRSTLGGFSRSYQTTLARRQAESDAVEAEIGRVDIGDRALRSFYAAHPEQFVQTLCLRQILWPATDPQAEAHAQAVRAQLAAGADFAALARQNPGDPASAAQGGSLGCVDDTGIDQYVQPFADAVRKLGPGELSPPVQTQYGWHVVQVTSRTTLPFDDRARAIARAAALAPAATAYATQLVARSTRVGVTVAAKFGRWDTSDPAHPHLVPPVPPAPGPGPPSSAPPSSGPPSAPSASTTTAGGSRGG
jgi:peptidyl-prolyl cis-trans isomerase C